jgi:hypothetical protein
MGKKDEKKRQRESYHRASKTGGKSTKIKKKSPGRKVK